MTRPEENPRLEHAKREIIRSLEAEVATTLGRRYRIDLAVLDLESLRELRRLLRDLVEEKEHVARQARLQPWRLWRPGR